LQAGNSLSGESIKRGNILYISYGKNVAVTYSELLDGKI
jgi:hypothetical protein